MTQTLGSRVAANSPDADSGTTQQLNALAGTEVDTASGAIAIKEGTVLLAGSSAIAMTLAVPTAGAQPAGDDGRVLEIVGVTAHAHTVTTPSNGINGNKHVETFANLGDITTLYAYNGVWYRSAAGTTTAS